MKFKFPEITIYDKYMFKQVVLASLVVILLFSIVWIAPEILLSTIRKALAGEYGFKTAILILFYQMPKILDKAFPVGLLLGTLFTFDKMSKDSEITIFRAVGMSFPRIIAPVVFLSLIFTFLCFLTSDKGIPMAAEKMVNIKGALKTAQYIYTQKDDTGHPLLAVVVSNSVERELQNVIVLDFSNEIYQDVHQLSNIFSAKKGYAHNNKWTLEDITNYRISNDGIYFDIRHLDKMDVLNGKSAENAYTLMSYSNLKDRDINNKNLKNYVKLLKQEGLMEEYNGTLNKYLQRFFHPLVCILLAILGCILGFSKPREQHLIGFTIAVGCIFVYYITLPFFDLLAEKEILSPYITSTLPLLVFIAAICVFYKSKDL
ncbi:MAG: LptF/LptG family permease [Muribaculaceae bacterium]|nr:LptF/LptG family permease [Muribaculaceae bacterium]